MFNESLAMQVFRSFPVDSISHYSSTICLKRRFSLPMALHSYLFLQHYAMRDILSGKRSAELGFVCQLYACLLEFYQNSHFMHSDRPRTIAFVLHKISQIMFQNSCFQLYVATMSCRRAISHSFSHDIERSSWHRPERLQSHNHVGLYAHK
jgi:hypothetical protein